MAQVAELYADLVKSTKSSGSFPSGHAYSAPMPTQAVMNVGEQTFWTFPLEGETILRGNRHMVTLQSSGSFPRTFTGVGSPQGGWFKETLAALEQMSKLENDWNGYGSEAPNGDSRHSASKVLDMVADEEDLIPYINPSAEGGVNISFRSGDRYADIEFFNSGSVMGVIHEKGKEPEVWELSCDENELRAAIARIRTFIAA